MIIYSYEEVKELVNRSYIDGFKGRWFHPDSLTQKVKDQLIKSGYKVTEISFGTVVQYNI